MKENGKLVLVLHAFDIGPSKNLQKIEIAALADGNGTRSIYNCKLNFANLIDRINSEADVLITGLSSFNFSEELGTGRTAELQNIPWFVIADTHGSWGRPKAKDYIRNAIVIVASPDEIQSALDFGYQDAIYLGGPPEWGDFSDIASAKIDLGEKTTILVGGIKSATITNTLIKETVKAMSEIGRDWQMIFKPHQNENTDSDEDREKIFKNVNVVETEAKLINLLSVVDLSALTSGTTAVIQSAYLRTPCVYYEDEAIKDRMREQVGTSKWFPVESGACVKAGPDNMAEKIQELLTEKGVKKLQKQQEIVYPKPDTGKKPERRILDYIKSEL